MSVNDVIRIVNCCYFRSVAENRRAKAIDQTGETLSLLQQYIEN